MGGWSGIHKRLISLALSQRMSYLGLNTNIYFQYLASNDMQTSARAEVQF